jgi:hypothetical protein
VIPARRPVWLRDTAGRCPSHVAGARRDATLLAVVPIPGTGMSLAIVGYAIITSA